MTATLSGSPRQEREGREQCRKSGPRRESDPCSSWFFVNKLDVVYIICSGSKLLYCHCSSWCVPSGATRAPAPTYPCSPCA